MSAVTAPAPVAPAHASLPNVVRSEWTKLWSVRSTLWSLLALFVVSIGLSTLISWGASTDRATLAAGDFDPTGISLTGIGFGQLVIAVLAIMAISTEYSTGGIRVSLSAVPQRLTLLGAKVIVLLPVALLVGAIASFGSFFAGQAFFASKGVEAHLGDALVLRAVIGGALYLMATALFAFALGALLRHTAAAITAAVALLLVVPPLTGLLPGSVGDTVSKYFVSNAGQQIAFVVPSEDALGPWAGFAVFCAWGVVILAVAALLMSRRDA